MNILNNEKLICVSGGAISRRLLFGIFGAVQLFLVGLVDGLINPIKCNVK